MTVSVTHSTPADGSFTATGAAAWNANHTLTGVGTMAEQNANAVAITGGSVTGITDLAIADGGTGASTAPDALTNLGAYPANNPSGYTNNTGTVTSVAATVPTGLSVGGSPITTNGTLAITYAAGYSIPTTSSQTNWDTAYTDRLKWDGGSTGLNAATARTSLGLVIGTNVLAPDGSAANLTSFPTFNQNTTGTAANVTGTVAIANGGTGATDAATALTNLGAYAANNPSGYTSNTGTVTSVGWTGGIVSVGSQTTTPAFTIAGTSGGLPYFSSGTAWASSGVLAANALVIGGGAATAPSTTTTGTGVITALGTNTGTVGSFVVNGGALGTPSGGTVTNLTGTASININGTVGATTATTGAFTTISASGAITSTVATGTAPFTVASTTQVANLQAATAGSAATLTTSRAIYGNNFNGSADLTEIIASTYGGTVNGFTKFSGATSAEKTYTLPDATTTILTTNAAVTIAQGGTGETAKTAAFDALSPTTTKGDLIVSNGTDNIRLPVGTNTHVLTADSTEPSGLKWVAGGGGGGSGTVTSVDATVPSFLSVSGNPITTSGTLAFSLASTPTNGQLLIGNGTGFSYATLTEGSGISITNGSGSIEISATGGGGGGLTQAQALKLVSLRL